jgi:hypothetical protein
MFSGHPVTKSFELMFRPLSLLVLGFVIAVTATLVGERFSSAPADLVDADSESDIRAALDDLQLVHDINADQFRPYEIGSKDPSF